MEDTSEEISDRTLVTNIAAGDISVSTEVTPDITTPVSGDPGVESLDKVQSDSVCTDEQQVNTLSNGVVSLQPAQTDSSDRKESVELVQKEPGGTEAHLQATPEQSETNTVSDHFLIRELPIQDSTPCQVTAGQSDSLSELQPNGKRKAELQCDEAEEDISENKRLKADGDLSELTVEVVDADIECVNHDVKQDSTGEHQVQQCME